MAIFQYHSEIVHKMYIIHLSSDFATVSAVLIALFPA